MVAGGVGRVDGEAVARPAREAGDRTQEVVVLAFSVMGLLYGPEPVPSALDKIAEIQARGPGGGRLEVSALRARAYLEALRGLAPRDLRYLGLIGSRAKVARIYERLQSDGMPAAQLERVHAPIGLDIGAVTPQEIAVSILAELIAVKHGKDADLSMQWTPPSVKSGSPSPQPPASSLK